MLSLFHRISLDGFSWLNFIKLRGKDKQSDKTWDNDEALLQVQLILLFNYQFKIIASVIKGFEGPLRFPDAFHIHSFMFRHAFTFVEDINWNCVLQGNVSLNIRGICMAKILLI